VTLISACLCPVYAGYKLSPLFNSTFDKLKNMLENDKPIVAGDWTNSEVDLINEKVLHGSWASAMLARLTVGRVRPPPPSPTHLLYGHF
jgi:hypothetical protein